MDETSGTYSISGDMTVHDLSTKVPYLKGIFYIQMLKGSAEDLNKLIITKEIRSILKKKKKRIRIRQLNLISDPTSFNYSPQFFSLNV